MHKYNEIPQTALEKFEEQVENLRAEVADKEEIPRSHKIY